MEDAGLYLEIILPPKIKWRRGALMPRPPLLCFLMYPKMQTAKINRLAPYMFIAPAAVIMAVALSTHWPI